MLGHANYRVVFPVLVILSFTLSGCGKGSSTSPPRPQVQDAIAAALPPFLSIETVDIEPIATGSESAKVNFKAIVSPKEDLCRVVREVEGNPSITLLKVAQAAGTKLSLYGSVEGRRTMDLWTLESPHIQTGLDQLGKPKGDFQGEAYVTGTNEAATALKQQAANAEAERQAKEAALREKAAEEKAEAERREIARKAEAERLEMEEKAQAERDEKQRREMEEQRAAIAEENRKSEEKRKAEKEAARQNVLLATMAGSHYSGTVRTEKDDFMRMTLVFGEQNEKERVVRARIVNPENPKWWRNLAGELHFEEGAEHPIIMLPADAAEETELRSKIVNINCDSLEGVYVAQWGGGMAMRLRLSDDGLEGEIRVPAGILGSYGSGRRLAVSLIRGEGPPPKVQTDAPKTPSKTRR
ncbi:MAG: cell envelope integrity protein TolA [Rhodopirellula sp.]|nr:cell envelope integrity protein TolA [Rhodopirellula sp.]